jgi:hypothetical protein
MSVACADIDGDNNIEIITGGYYDDGTRDVAQLCVWTSSTLALECVQTWYWTTDTYIRSVASADIDIIGNVEIVTGGSYTQTQLCVWAVDP